MEQISSKELRSDLAEAIKKVQGGNVLILESHGRPQMGLVPVEWAKFASDIGAIDKMIKELPRDLQNMIYILITNTMIAYAKMLEKGEIQSISELLKKMAQDIYTIVKGRVREIALSRV